MNSEVATSTSGDVKASSPADACLASRERPVLGLVTRARDGDEQAWAGLVERYAPLIWSICRRYGLSAADAADVGQSVWLHLVDHLGDLRTPPRCPAGWRPPPGVSVSEHSASCRVRWSATCGTSMPFPMSRPSPESKNCLRPSATRHYARRSRTYLRAVSD